MLITLALVAGCGNPLDGGGGATATPSDAEPALDPLTIVTATAVDPASIATEVTGSPTPLVIPDTYVVQEGDTLYSISAKFNIDLASLVEANNLSDPNDIQVGQELTLPRPSEQEP